MKNNKRVINKSRYGSIDSYISLDDTFKEKYNDLDLVYDSDIYNKLQKNGVEDLLAKHLAHLFIRDPLVIFEELLDVDDEQSSDHFEVRNDEKKKIEIKQVWFMLSIPLIEPSINQLANGTIQTSPT